MAGYTQTFGGSTIYPAGPSYLSLAFAANVNLQWPTEQQIGGNNIVADIIDLNATAPGLNVNLPDARQVSTGFTALFNNVGANTVDVRNSVGGTLVSLTSGTVWQLYLSDNSTAAGTWRVFQYGASVSVVNAAALAGSGLKAIVTSLNQSMPVSAQAATPYVVQDADRAKVLMWTGGVGGFTLPNPAAVGSDWYVNVRNSGSGDLTLTPAAGQINGAASLTVAAGGSAIVFTDGANYYTVGSGAGSSGGGTGFDFVVINVAGSGDFVLSGVNLNRVGYRFTGVLTGTRNIVVPGSIAEYWVDNETTGAFNLFVKTVAQVPGIQVSQLDRNILYCDGTNVLAAESATVSFPIPVNQGGTGSITAAAARTALGSTAVGDSVFTAVSAVAARTAISALGAGDTLLAAAGSAGTPGISFSGDPNTGLYSSAADVVGLSAGGGNVGEWSARGVGVANGSPGTPSLYLQNSNTTGIYRAAADYLAFSVLGVFKGGFAAAGLNMIDGSAGNPSFTFDGDPDTGIYRNTINSLAFTSGGVTTLTLTSLAVVPQLIITPAIDGSAGAPLYSFANDPDTGFYRIGANQLGFAEGGTGFFVGFRNIPQNSQGGNYTGVATDAGKHIYRSAGGAATWTIPADASVSYAIGTTLTFINDSATSVTISITSDTLRFSPNGATGNRTLSQYGMATAVKTAATTWTITGSGLN